MLRGPKKTGPQALGRSRGGLGTQIHATVDALGSSLRWVLTGGAPAWIDGFNAQAVVADKGYDANAFDALINAAGASAVIPPFSNRTEQRVCDHHLYNDRNLVERFFKLLKQFRRIATPHEKIARNFTSMRNLVCAYLWLT